MSESLENYDPYSSHEPLPMELLGWQRMAGVVGVISLAIFLIGLIQPEHFFRALLFAWHFWLSISLGCLGFVFISHMTGGGWGTVIRRIGEAAFMNIFFLIIPFLVMILGYKYLFPWGHMEDFNPDVVYKTATATTTQGAFDRGLETAYKVLRHREVLFAPMAFTVRTLIYFFIWGWFAYYLRSGSIRLDRGPDLYLRRSLRKASAAGLVLLFVTATGYALDYISGRETNWYSSILGFITIIGTGTGGVAFMSLMVCYFSNKRPIKDVLVPQHTNDLGNILLALVILWMYTTFSQFLIQWNGNMPEDISYYVSRGIGVVRNNWQWITLILLLGHFFIPFFLLLQKPLKRNPATFARIAVLLLVIRVFHELWVVAPNGPHRGNPWMAHPSTNDVYWQDIFAFLGIGGIWFYLFVKNLASQPLLAKNIADQPKVLTHGTPAHAH